uniref:GrpE protein homolog n=1 Tax=Clastoptera arizonana TaxID=38151 RepID=A0A1B6CDT7_9HEMI
MVSVPLYLRNYRLIIDQFKYQPLKKYKRICVQYNLYENMWSTCSNRFSSTVEKEKNETEDIEKTTDVKLQIEELSKQISSLSKEKDEYEDKYKRSLADGENLRRRMTKQIDDAKLFGIQSFCKDLLEVADILGKATECVPKEEVSDDNPHLKNLYEGLTLTEAELKKVFTRHGLIPVNPLNEKFNPNLHEALFQQEVEGKTAGTVVVVSKIGYKLHERCIRPALVGVAKGS